jgi:two-component system, NarL family, sensor kinase
MKYLIATILSFAFASFVIAQPSIDSLRGIMFSSQPYKETIKAWLAFVEHFRLKDFDTTIDAGNKALALARSNGDSVSVAKLKRDMGVANYFSGHYEVAAKNYYEAAAILEQQADPDNHWKSELANVYNEIAKLYRKTRDLDRSLQNYDKAMGIFQQLNDSAGISMILNESGVVFEYKENYDEAIRRYSASLAIAQQLKDSVGIAYALNFIAGVQTIQKKYDEAEKNLLQALQIRKNLKDSFSIALTYTDLGATLNARGNYSKAVGYLDASNRIAEQIHYPELMSNNYNELGSIAEKQGDYQKSLQYFQKKVAIRDSLFSIEKTKQIEELNTKYQTVKIEQIIEQQRNRITTQNFLFIGTVALVLMIGLLSWSLYKRYKLRKETQLKTEIMKQQELATKAVIEAEEVERQRIARDLHDGVGQMMSAAKMNLSAFECDIKFNSEEQRNSFETIIGLVDESCKEVRHVSHNMMPNVLLKKSLASALQDFIDKIDKKSLQVHLYSEGLDDRLDSNTETVLYRVIQECVNNVIKHATATSLDISVIRDKDGISATIEDNGKGFDTGAEEKMNGIGLKNIRTRIEYLKGTVEFDSAAGKGTAVSLHVPVVAVDK